MKIAILSRYQESVQRGAEIFVQELSNHLSDKNDVTILSGKESDSLPKILRGHYDVVIPINGRLQSLVASLGRLLSGYKILISGHSGIGRDDRWNLMVSRPDAFIALTDFMFKWAKKWSFGVPVFKIPNGVNLDKFYSKGEKLNLGVEGKIVLSVGALVPQKRHELAIEAVSKLNNVSLVIAGKGEQKQYLTLLAQKKLPGRFKILDLDYTDMPRLYRSVDVFTLPSWEKEAFGIVYLEALASNLPIVAPNDPSRREIIDKAGVLVDVTNSKAYSLSLDHALKTDWGDLPRKQAEKFDWNVIGKKYEDILHEITKLPSV